jgi:hypothetical protein
MSFTGTADELDAPLPDAIVSFLASHLELKNTLERAKEEMDAAAKAAQEEARNKTKNNKKAANRTREDGGACCKKGTEKRTGTAAPAGPLRYRGRHHAIAGDEIAGAVSAFQTCPMSHLNRLLQGCLNEDEQVAVGGQ